MMSAQTDPIGAVLAELRARLRGPRGVRTELLREVEDGLRDATAAYQEAGAAPLEAARLAVADFGHSAELLPLYQAELDACQGRRAAMLIAVVYPALTLTWDLLWRFASVGDGEAAPNIASLASLLDLGSLAAAATAAATIPFFGRGSPALVRPLALGIAAFGWLTLVATVSASLWMSLSNGGNGAREVESSLPGIGVVLLTTVAVLACARSATLTLLRVGRPRLTRRPAPIAAR